MKYKCHGCGLEFNLPDLAYWDSEGFYCEVETIEEYEKYACECDSCTGKDIMRYYGVQ